MADAWGAPGVPLSLPLQRDPILSFLHVFAENARARHCSPPPSAGLVVAALPTGNPGSATN